MNRTERLTRALTGKSTDRVPVTSLMTGVTVDFMETAGIYWPEANKDADKMVKLAAAAFEYCGIESMKLPFDMTVETEALGGNIDYGTVDSLPTVRGNLLDDDEDLKFDETLLQKGRIPTILKAIKKGKTDFGDQIPVVSSIVGPFTLGTLVFGFPNFLGWIAEEPEKLDSAMEKLTQLCIMYTKAQTAAGSDVIQIGEAACSGDMISPDTYGRHIAPFHRKLCEKIKLPSVVHICGNITGHLKYIADTKMNGLSFDEKTDVDEAVRLLKGKVALIGYIPTLEVLLNGTPDDVYKRSGQCIARGVDVLNAGCAWPPKLKNENIRAMVSAALDSGK